MHLASCLQLPRAWSAFYLRPYLELLLLFLLALEAAVSSSDVCRCISSREETLGLGGGGGPTVVAFPACLWRLHVSPPGGAPVKVIRPLVYILSPSPCLLFPSLPSSPGGCSPWTISRPLAHSGAPEIVQTWARSHSSLGSEPLSLFSALNDPGEAFPRLKLEMSNHQPHHTPMLKREWDPQLCQELL